MLITTFLFCGCLPTSQKEMLIGVWESEEKVIEFKPCAIAVTSQSPPTSGVLFASITGLIVINCAVWSSTIPGTITVWLLRTQLLAYKVIVVISG